MASRRFAEVFAPAPLVTCMSTRAGRGASRSRKATSWNCSRSCPTSANPPLACHARSISPRRCRVSKWPSPRTRDAAPLEDAAGLGRLTRPPDAAASCLSLLLGLPADGVLRRGDGLLVAEEPPSERLQLLVQFVEYRDAGGNVEVHDVALGHHVEHLDQGAQ